ncbi:MAG: SPOR domain-containing protein [Acidobacteria bacterium]|nr:SPOR domain-containing protein [Acidobacteriota bacterium]
MVHALKNIVIRLWIATATGGLATLGLLAVLGSPLETAFNLIVAFILIALAFWGCGWIFNRITAQRLQDCYREATSRERTARIGEAAEAFRKAVILFDSFMVSPLYRRRAGRDLAGRIARFHIARSVRHPEAEGFIASYLWTHPDDGEVAEYWLQHTRLGDGADPDHLALADHIATVQVQNPTILSLIAQIYLARNRTDYTALQIYKRLLQESNHIQAQAVLRLAGLFFREGRTDELALEVYLKACRRAPDRTEYLQGLAACLDQIRATERNESLITESRQALGDIDEDTIRQWQEAFRLKATPSAPKEPAISERALVFISGLARLGVRGIVHSTGTTASFLAQWGRIIGKSWKESARTRYIAKWAAVSVFAAVVFISGIRTVIYISETKESPESAPPPTITPQVAASGRYTIQAASFRNQAQAVSYSERLKNQGFPAYWGESRSTGKEVWYYVRISRFEGKQEAKEFGEDLKNKGIIDDFYVANYKAP